MKVIFLNVSYIVAATTSKWTSLIYIASIHRHSIVFISHYYGIRLALNGLMQEERVEYYIAGLSKKDYFFTRKVDIGNNPSGADFSLFPYLN